LDFKYIYEIGKDIGLKITKKMDGSVEVDPTNIHSACIDHRKSSFFRTSYYFIGSLLHKFKKVSIGYPGGDNFGSRPIDQHIKGFEAMGAKFTFFNDYYIVEAEKLEGANIYFDVITSGATMNLLMAAVKAEGRTVLRNAARDPEVVDVAIFLNSMGARIKGAGTSTITIDGVSELHGCDHTAIPDRLIAGAFLMAAGITRGKLTIEDIIPEHLDSCTAKLEETGMFIETGENYITAIGPEVLRGVNVKAGMYPEFATDFQQPLTAILTGADGNSTIMDPIFPGRFGHCVQLNRMGADIIMRDGSAVIPGRRKLKGDWVHASDIRAGICLIIAALAAEGTTYITGVEHIERGYADIVRVFNSIGASI
jgi:UDP-N-acetylglucosamine 1-carboxyvinyltransferase